MDMNSCLVVAWIVGELTKDDLVFIELGWILLFSAKDKSKASGAIPRNEGRAR